MILGSVIAILGAGLLVTLFFLSPGAVTTDQVSTQNQPVDPNVPYSEVVSPSSVVAGSITLTWSASGVVNVTLSPEVSCPRGSESCPPGPPVLSWQLASSGKGTVAHVNSSAYILEVVNPGNGLALFSDFITVAFQQPPPVPTWGWGLIAGGGVVLLAIGGIATFLGLFLPSGVYTRADGGTPIRPPLDRPPEDSDLDPAVDSARGSSDEPHEARR